MITVSDAFLEAMETRRDFRCRASVTLADGSSLSLTENDFTVSGNRVATGCGNTSAFPVGNAAGRTCYLELVNHDGRFNSIPFQGSKFVLSLVFPLSDGEEIIRMGSFTVTDPETKGHTVIITAHDDMHKADVEYVPTITFPNTLLNLAFDVCHVCGIQFSLGSVAQLPDITINTAPTEYTCRQILGALAMIVGGNAVISGRYDQLYFLRVPVNETSHHTIRYSDFFSVSADAEEIAITGVSAKVTDVVDGNVETRIVLQGEEGYVISFDNPLWAGYEEEILSERLGPLLIGKSFTRFDGELPADPRIEFMDRVAYQSEDGSEHFSFVTDLDFSFLGATDVSCSAPDSSMVNSVYRIDPNTDKKVEAANEQIAQLKNNGKYLEAIVSDLQGAVTSTMTSTEIRAEIQQAVEGVSSIDTKTGVKLDLDGLTVYRTGNNIKNLITNEGMYVQRTAGDGSREEDILVADQSGVNALNLTARQYLTIGENSRFEDFIDDNGNKRTACFWVG